MFVVYDNHEDRLYGPFETKDGADNWIQQFIETNAIDPDSDSELTVHELLKPE